MLTPRYSLFGAVFLSFSRFEQGEHIKVYQYDVSADRRPRLGCIPHLMVVESI
jgi:hypothetical protein